MEKAVSNEDAGGDQKTGAQTKIAMSKALGQQWLKYQVSQMEAGTGTGHGHGLSASRRGRYSRRGGAHVYMDDPPRTIAPRSAPSEGVLSSHAQDTRLSSPKVSNTRIIVDASVLIHALEKVRKWCVAEKAVHIIIPLEALNTLDLLKKGNSVIAANARAASRVLEEQVGSNTRVTVQDDHAVTEWMSLTFTEGDSPKSAPQWVRATLCCAVWEKEHSNGEEVMIAVMSKLPPASESTVKWHDRAEGQLVQEWAERLCIPVLPVHERRRVDNQKEHTQGMAWRASSDTQHSHERSPGQSRKRSGRSSSGSFTGPLVDKPPAVMPTTGIRLLARGEMLAP